MKLIKGQNSSQNASERASNLTEIRFSSGGGGFDPLVHLPGPCPGPTGSLVGPQTPCLLCFYIVIGLATPLAVNHKISVVWHSFIFSLNNKNSKWSWLYIYLKSILFPSLPRITIWTSLFSFYLNRTIQVFYKHDMDKSLSWPDSSFHTFY